MSKKVTIEQVRAKVAEMSDVTIARCYLSCDPHWGYCDYWLVFTDPDVHERVYFERIGDVWNWLMAFEEPTKFQSGGAS